MHVDAWLGVPAFLGVSVSGAQRHVLFTPIGVGEKSSVNHLQTFWIHWNKREEEKKSEFGGQVLVLFSHKVLERFLFMSEDAA